FRAIDAFLRKTFSYVDTNEYKVVGLSASYYIGNSEEDCVKLDLFYTDEFIQETILIDGIRMATVEEIIAMKTDVISRGGRKKDFWDIHELMDDYSIEKMLALHKQRYPYTHDQMQIKSSFSNFENADDDFVPICLKGKYWEIIKLDIIDFVK
ncbi:MAG: nucleotidyl transferase AbiEii/AbiGii toxin family protein, partial [Bacteroidales bacterium]|nr:nucleotidyl transferase AbiEii/AbiGii toxin family protein [Bacteroidales bacterium]